MRRGTPRPSLETMEARRLFAAGDIDATFALGGLLDADLGGDQDRATQVLQAPGGKALVLAQISSTGQLAVARINSNGTLDSSFGVGGKALTSLNAPYSDRPGAVAVDSTGRFAALYGNNGSGAPNGVAVFNENGTLDTSFSSDGLLQVDGAFLSFEGVGFQPDGRLILAGMGYDVTNAPPEEPIDYYDYYDPVLVRRYSTSGAMDASFGTGTGASAGTTALTIADGLHDMTVMPDGRIVLATHFNKDATTNPDLLGQEIYRLSPNGQLDSTLNGSGALRVGTIADPLPSDYSLTLDMQVLSDGSMVILSQEGMLQLKLRKFTASGAPVSDFTTELERIGRFPQRVGVAEGTGNIFLSDNGSVMRYNARGSADYTYGVDGVATVANGAAMLVSSDGTVIVGGSTPPLPEGTDLRLVRLQGGEGAPRRPTLNRKGTLIFRTTNASENIGINYRSRDARLIVRLDDFVQSYAPSKVKRIAIFAMDGNDTVTIGLNVRGVYVDGGDGNDTISGGELGDVLLGGAGADEIRGNDGDDKLLGGPGNDYLLGGAGKDDLFGDEGQDTLSGAGGNDRLFGGPGADFINGGAGIDSAADSDEDTYSGIEALLT